MSNQIMTTSNDDDISHVMVRKDKTLRSNKWIKIVSIQILTLVIIFGSWQLFSMRRIVNPLYVSEPSSILMSFLRGIGNGSILSPLEATLYETVVGFVIGAIIGNILAYFLYEVKALEAAWSPFLTAINNLPRFALAPLFVLWFGLGSNSRIALVISLVFFIVFINTFAGLKSADRDHLLLAATLGVRGTKLQRWFIIPTALPSIFAGLQLGLTYAFLTAVVGEMLSGGSGIGAQLVVTSASYEMNDFFSYLLALVIVATALAMVMRLIEKRLLKWKLLELRGLS